MGARKVNWLFKVTEGHHWNWNSTVWLPKPKFFSLHVRWQKIEPQLLYSNAKPMADINNQLHNSLWMRETQNPCQSWPLSSQRGHVKWDWCVISVASHTVLWNYQNNCKELVESRTKWDSIKVRICQTISNVHYVATFLFKINLIGSKFAHQR